HRQTAWPCEGQRSHDVTNRVREIRTPGSVGALGGNPQSDPARGAPGTNLEVSYFEQMKAALDEEKTVQKNVSDSVLLPQRS
ncbi:MAG: hypothetical protein ACLQU5_09455, partial [Isosphaeraceae bacterium]